MTGEAQALAPARRRATPVVRLRRAIRRVLLYALTIGLVLLFAFPGFWTLSSSLKTSSEIYQFPPTLLPAIPQWANYAEVLTRVPFLQWTLNSGLVTVLATIGTVLSAALVAYSFARFEYPGRDLFFLITVSTMMLPVEITVIPQFLLFNAFGWIDTFLPLIVPYWFGGTAFFIFLLRQFFMTIPRELDAAAMIDGASSFRIFWQIILPLSRPALATAAVISFIQEWDSFLLPLIFLNSPGNFTLGIGLRYFQQLAQSEQEPQEHLLMAASVLIIVPMVVVFFFAQRYFVRGIIMSGLKG